MANTKMVATMIGLVVVILLVANLAPVALGGESGLFNQSRDNSITCEDWNATSGTCITPTGVPSWAPTVLAILGVVAFIYIMLRVSRK